jgi:hypothetical protein
MSTGDQPFCLVAYPATSTAGSVLYIRIGNSDISRLGPPPPWGRLAGFLAR